MGGRTWRPACGIKTKSMFDTLKYTALILTILLTIYIASAPLITLSTDYLWAVGISIAFALVGVAASSTVLWSSQNSGRRANLGLALAALYIAPVFPFALSLAPIHLFLVPALMVFALALFNKIRNRKCNPG